MNIPVWLDPTDPNSEFPPVELALSEPDGLLAIGGDLSATRLLNAYRRGIFPWYNREQPILWWSPDPRTVIRPAELNISRSLKKSLRNRGFQMRFDTAFEAVLEQCAQPRSTSDETWINSDIQTAYCHLHDLGYAHSVEAWNEDGHLIGGLYGIALGRVFFGESMFARSRDASKACLAHLCALLHHWEFRLIDCQVYNPHLESLGAQQLDRNTFSQMLSEECGIDKQGKWSSSPEYPYLW